MPVETLTYAALGARLTISAGAARSLAARLRLPRSVSDDGKTLVSVDLAEIRHTRRPRSRREAGNVAALAARIVALQAEISRLEATAAGHRADFERERERADRLMVELLQADGRDHGGQGNDGAARRFSAGQWPNRSFDRQPWHSSTQAGASGCGLGGSGSQGPSVAIRIISFLACRTSLAGANREAEMTDITDIREMKARIIVFGVGGAGGNAVNNMIASGLQGVDFIVANTDAQALATSKAKRIIQLGTEVTQGLGAGSQPELGRAAAEEAVDAIRDHLTGAHMVFVTAGMGGGTGTGAAPVIARTARELGILTIGVVTKPFQFEGQRRMRSAEAGIAELLKVVDTLLVIPNQNLFRVANEKTTFANAFVMADQVLYSGVACISDLIVKEGLINLDFADVLTVMREKGKAMMGRGEASGEKRVLNAAVAAISNPLIEDPSIKRASGLIISITGGKDLTLFEIEEAATRIREEVDHERQRHRRRHLRRQPGRYRPRLRGGDRHR